MNVVTLEFKKCCECGQRATKKLELLEWDERGVVGPAEPKHYCDAHFPKTLDDGQLRALVDQRDDEIVSFAQALKDALLALRDTDVKSLEDRMNNAILTLDRALQENKAYRPLKEQP
jgi:hypothetical protein